MKLRWFILIALINFIFQTTFVEQFRICGIAPNTALILVVGATLICGVRQGLTVAAVSGLLQDLLFSKAFGICTLIYCCLAVVIGLMEGKLYKDNWLTPAVVMAGSTLCFHVLFFIVMFFARDTASLSIALTRIFPLEALLNTLIFLVFYRRVFRAVYGYGLS